ncbi:MAG TPA: mechanosensitive ion channel family protein [Pyrinomonadaceae bacterium]|nr:mechanosensitive ion channel family protein [Pyrinomonadaceae bacterium]
MTSSEVYKKAISLTVFVAVVGTILSLMSLSDERIEAFLTGQGLPTSAIITITKIVTIILSMLIVIAIVRFAAFLMMRSAVRRSAQPGVSSLLKTVLSIVVYIIAFVLIFQNQYQEVQLSALFTGSTIVGIVVGLALQDTLGNLFAGIAMQADQPFQVGDVVSIQNRGMGVVEGVSWRGVKIRTFQNKLLIISNSVLGKETIEVAPRDNLNARVVFFNTAYSYSPSRTSNVVREALRFTENISRKRHPVVRIRNFGESSIDWEAKYWIEDYTRHADTDALVRERIWYAFQREKIEFAFPTRTLVNQEAPADMPLEEKVTRRSVQLARIPVFAPLSEAEIERLASTSKTRVYAAGESIVEQGAEGTSMFVITRGSVNVVLRRGQRTEIINSLGEDDFFGEMSLLTGQPRSATVVATSETEVLQIGKRALKPILENNEALVLAVSDRIQERLKKLSENEVVVGELQEADAKSTGMIRSIRKFFGLKGQKGD